MSKTGVETMMKYKQAIPYFTTDARLLEQVIPIKGNRTAVLDPDMTAPGNEPKPGKIIGAVFQPSRDVMVVVAVFKADKLSEPPEKIRFYYTSTAYYEYSYDWGTFSSSAALDAGAVVAHKYSCVTVGMEQVCWQPYNTDLVREKSTPKNIADAAYSRLKNVYDLTVDFYVDDAVPDLLGHKLRTNCRANLKGETNFYTKTQGCKPNLIFTAAKERKPGQPLGIFVVLRKADVMTYNYKGRYVGKLPPGEYLVMDSTPHIATPGSVAVIALINIDTVNHYLIPVMVLEGFGSSSAIDKPKAAIKDGFVWGKGFGY
jgi:hypothetical protein